MERFIEHPAITPLAVLRVENLFFSYPQRPLFTDWSARIASGVTLIQGDDGSGKTTLLRLLAGELPAHAGRLQINGIQLDTQPLAYRQQVFWVDPRSEAFDQISATDYFNTLAHQYPGFNAHLLAELTDGLSLEPHLSKPLYMLSTGSKRKVWLAAAFASGAAVTLLDSPFAALDAASINFVLELLESAADHPARAWIVADYAAPGEVPLATVIDLLST